MKLLKRLWFSRVPRPSMLDVSEYEGYIIACALRGPDLPIATEADKPYGGLLKEVFTMRIRALAGVDGRLVPTRRGRLTRAEAEQLEELVHYLDDAGANSTDLLHFLFHVAEAATALGDTGLARLAARTIDACTKVDPMVSLEEIVELAGGSD